LDGKPLLKPCKLVEAAKKTVHMKRPVERIDGLTRWQSGLMKRENAAKRVDVDVTGANTLELITTDGGNGLEADHADWADAKLLR